MRKKQHHSMDTSHIRRLSAQYIHTRESINHLPRSQSCKIIDILQGIVPNKQRSIICLHNRDLKVRHGLFDCLENNPAPRIRQSEHSTFNVLDVCPQSLTIFDGFISTFHIAEFCLFYVTRKSRKFNGPVTEFISGMGAKACFCLMVDSIKLALIEVVLKHDILLDVK
jgi:hypothetical protein